MYLGFYQHYRNGFLWRGGGIGDQTYRFLQAMAACDEEWNACEAELREAAKNAKHGPIM